MVTNFRNDIPTELVVKFYEEGCSVSKLKDLFFCDRKAITNRLQQSKTPVRHQSHYLRNNKHAAGEKNHRWSGGTDQYWKRVLVEERGNFCEVCGYSIVIQVHHIDEDRKNNTRENLVLVCPNCHFANHHSRTHKLKKVNAKWSLSPIQI
jgi:5-methylcytosine-specific restriction endonuclease McrA